MQRTFRAAFLAGTSLALLALPAFSAPKKDAPPPPDPRIPVLLEQELRDVQSQLAEIKKRPGRCRQQRRAQ